MSLCFKYIYCSEKTNPHKVWDWIFGQPERRILILICPLVCVWRNTPNTSGMLSLIFVLNISSPVLQVELNHYLTEHIDQKDKSIWSEVGILFSGVVSRNRDFSLLMGDRWLIAWNKHAWNNMQTMNLWLVITDYQESNCQVCRSSQRKINSKNRFPWMHEHLDTPRFTTSTVGDLFKRIYFRWNNSYVNKMKVFLAVLLKIKV